MKALSETQESKVTAGKVNFKKSFLGWRDFLKSWKITENSCHPRQCSAQKNSWPCHNSGPTEPFSSLRDKVIRTWRSEYIYNGATSTRSNLTAALVVSFVFGNVLSFKTTAFCYQILLHLWINIEKSFVHLQHSFWLISPTRSKTSEGLLNSSCFAKSLLECRFSFSDKKTHCCYYFLLFFLDLNGDEDDIFLQPTKINDV